MKGTCVWVPFFMEEKEMHYIMAYFIVAAVVLVLFAVIDYLTVCRSLNEGKNENKEEVQAEAAANRKFVVYDLKKN